jgi:hypothetical protein
MAQVVDEVEMVVVDPHRVAEQRHVRQLLAEAWMISEPQLDGGANSLHIEPPVRPLQRLRVKQADRSDVHVHGVIFQLEEAGIERCQPITM